MLIQNVLPIALIIVSASAETSYRLSTDVTPKRYMLDLTVDPDKDTFDGIEQITLAISKATDKIFMHASPKFLDIKNIALTRIDKDRKTLKYNCAYLIHDTTEILTIACPVQINADDVLEISFQGKLSTEDMDGFYRSSYMEGGKQKNLAATQFEPVYARRAFPCFDEPTFKAQFQVYITHPAQYTALFNTPAAGKLKVDQKNIRTEFVKTPEMSTYLVAFVVSEFVKAKDSDSSSSQYKWNVFARPSAKDSMGTALTYTPQLIDHMSKWTGLDYITLGNTQIYQVGIPDFAAGAMENWGLITYREVDLLDEGKHTSANSKQTIIQTIAHELSHQWFGDYVTIDWWSNLWLNEGFATYFQCHLANLVESGGMELDKQFLTSVIHKAFQSDALDTTMPISNKASEINTPAEINKKFDDISYSKAGSVIRMLKHLLGEDVFQTALRNYLKSNAHGNTSPKILLKNFNDATKDYKNIEEIMDNWIYKAGFPLVHVDRNETVITITQERFNSNATTQWFVPITYATSKDLDFSTKVKMLLEPGKKTVIKDVGEDITWIMLNTQVSGFYRVNYDEGLWTGIIQHLKTKPEDIHVLNRAQLIDDIFNIAKVGKVEYSIAFSLSSYLKNEKDYYPWNTAFKAFSFLIGKVDKDTDDMLKDLLREYINSAFEKLPTGTSDKHVEKLRNALIVQWACEVGHDECHKYANDQFEAYKKTQSIEDYDKRETVFCYALKQSLKIEDDYEFMLNQFKKSSYATEQGAILRALGCIGNVMVLNRYLNETIKKDSAIRKQDAQTVFSSVLANSDNGLEVALKFLELNFDDIALKYKGLNAITRISTELASNIVNPEQSERLIKILEDHRDNEEVKLVSKQVHELLKTNQQWSATFGSEIKSLLTKSKNGAAVSVSINVAVAMMSCLTFLFLNY